MDAHRREESEALHARVQRFIVASTETSEPFDTLACAIARYQARYVAPVGKLMRGLDPQRADDIVALPTDAFRLRRIAAHPEEEDERCFVTSGTTAELRGRHPMRTTATYRLSALTWARARLITPCERLIVLGPSETNAPESSLTFMLARFAETMEASWHGDGERLDVAGALGALAGAREPVLLAGTSFAFVHFCDGGARATLPPGSRVMHTGGTKGRSRAVDPAALRTLIAERVGLGESAVIGEYGMTELSSQLYQKGERYFAPPWMRVNAVDPETLAPTRGVGLGRFVDLANVDSAVAVQTADLVEVFDDGSIALLGRAPGATPRGCSLVLEHLLERP
jgi:hypothetical protein